MAFGLTAETNLVRHGGMSTIPNEVTEIQNALSGLGATIGIPELAWDEQGYCALQFDGITVNLEHEKEAGQIYIMARVGQAPGHEGDRLAVYQKLLEYNCVFRGTGGGVLGVDGPEGGIILSYKASVDGLDGVRLTATIEGFLNMAEKFQGELVQGASGRVDLVKHESPDLTMMTLRV